MAQLPHTKAKTEWYKIKVVRESGTGLTGIGMENGAAIQVTAVITPIIAICLIPSTVSFFVAVCMIVTPPVLSDSFSFFLKDTPFI